MRTRTHPGEKCDTRRGGGPCLKNTYRGALIVLVTMNRKGHNESANVQRKIETNEAVGLDHCVVFEEGNEDFDELLNTLSTFEYSLAKPLMPLRGTVTA